MNKSSKLRILLLAPSFAPMAVPHSIRWTNIAWYLAEAGHSITVITRETQDVLTDESLASLVGLKNIEIIRVQARGSWLGRLLWVLTAFIQVLNVSPGSFDVFVTTSLPIWPVPIAAFFRGLGISKLWIADYGDPWALSRQRNRHFLRRNVEFLLEKIWLHFADALLITTPQAKHTFERVYKKRNRIFVLAQGASIFHLTVDWAKISGADPETLDLLYTGRFYRDIRDPGNLMVALSELDDVYLKIVGHVIVHDELDVSDYVNKLNISDKVEIHGYADLATTAQMQAECDVLVLFGNKTFDQIPGKTFEYLTMPKPILYITQHGQDEVANLIEKYDAGIVCSDSVDEIKKAIQRLKTTPWKMGTGVRKGVPGLGYDTRAGQFMDIVINLQSTSLP